jgi:hypothetical protein
MLKSMRTSLLLVVQPSSERTLDRVRRDNSLSREAGVSRCAPAGRPQRASRSRRVRRSQPRVSNHAPAGGGARRPSVDSHEAQQSEAMIGGRRSAERDSDHRGPQGSVPAGRSFRHCPPVRPPQRLRGSSRRGHETDRSRGARHGCVRSAPPPQLAAEVQRRQANDDRAGGRRVARGCCRGGNADGEREHADVVPVLRPLIHPCRPKPVGLVASWWTCRQILSRNPSGSTIELFPPASAERERVQGGR